MSPTMPLKSMTGFGRSDGRRAAVAWTWEARSVNGRGLDVRHRLPPGLDALEPKVRDAVQARFARGSINLTLALSREEGGAQIRINPAAIAAVTEAVRQFRAAIPGPTTVGIDGLLALRGVLDYAETQDSEAEIEARNAALLLSLDDALMQLAAAREAEGRRLETVLRDALTTVERLVAEVAAAPTRAPAAIEARLTEQIQRLAGQALDPARLHQEAMLIATRIDVEEELKRLSAHIAAARDLLALHEPVGRKFDFLTQEFNREANTLCSKANDPGITRAGLALKAVIDQMREQVQNIE